MKKQEYVFILDIPIDYTLKKYGIDCSNIITESNTIPEQATDIKDLSCMNPDKEFLSFVDESKTTINCCISMIKLDDLSPVIDSKYNCFWCRHSIPAKIIPIGCPIKYISNQAVKTYYSEISKDRYIIKENISEQMTKKIENDDRLMVLKNGYFLTDGSFCSFNCCMAFINDNKKHTMYNDSKSLLLKLYKHIHNKYIDKIEPAHHWRQLKEYGGKLSIEKFRDNFNKVKYVQHGKRIILPKLASVGLLFEEQIRF